jgi:integrase
LHRGNRPNTLSADAEPPERATFGGRMARNRRFQHGSLFKRGTRTKVWVARWWEDVIGTEGKLERVRRSEVLGPVTDIPTRRQAERILSDRLRGINSGDYRPQSSCTLSDFVHRTWFPEVLPTLKYPSKKHYEYIVNVHMIPAFGDMQLRLISRESVQSFLNGKLRGGLSWKTVKHIRTTFGTVLGAAEMRGLIQSNPARKTKLPRRGPVAEKTPIAPEKIRQLLEALPEPSRSLAWLLVLTGLRVGEALALRWCDIDLALGCLRVRQTVYEGRFDDPKSKRSKRTVPLGAKGIEILLGFKPRYIDSEALVFATRRGTPFCRRNLLQSSACADVRETRHRGCDLALATPCECDAARCGRYAAGNSAGPTGAFLRGGHAGDLLALSTSGCAQRGGKGRSTSDWTQMDPSCRRDRSDKYANSLIPWD